jgi:hypothetical protein
VLGEELLGLGSRLTKPTAQMSLALMAAVAFRMERATVGLATSCRPVVINFRDYH